MTCVLNRCVCAKQLMPKPERREVGIGSWEVGNTHLGIWESGFENLGIGTNLENIALRKKKLRISLCFPKILNHMSLQRFKRHRNNFT